MKYKRGYDFGFGNISLKKLSVSLLYFLQTNPNHYPPIPTLHFQGFVGSSIQSALSPVDSLLLPWRIVHRTTAVSADLRIFVRILCAEPWMVSRGVLVCHRLQSGISQLCSLDLVSLTSLVVAFLFFYFFFLWVLKGKWRRMRRIWFLVSWKFWCLDPISSRLGSLFSFLYCVFWQASSVTGRKNGIN